MKTFLTGRPGIGKTTVCLKAIELLCQRGVRCGGVVSREVREGGARTGFEFVDVETKQAFPLASNSGAGPRVGKYRVDLAGIARAVAILRGTKADVVFVDEIGPMELKSRDFKYTADELVRIDKHLVAVVHNRLAASFNCIEITAANRDTIPGEIASRYRAP